MKKKTSWSNFECIHSDVTDTFEQLCRILFKRQFLDNTCVLTSSPNHPGIEVSPIYSPKVNRTISFQAKYFLSRVDYSQIQKSVNKTIKKYAGQLDVFYLYCNKDLTLTSQSYKRIESTLKSVDIELRVISNNEILTQVAQYTDLQSFFFENHIITRDWFVTYNQLSFDSLGMRYNSEFNVETRTDEMIQLFIRNQKAIDKINSKKIELIKELDTLYSLRESEIISKIKKFIDSLEDVTVDDIENYLKWNDKINRSLESELKELSINKEKLENKIESTRDMSSENRNRIFNQVRDIDRLIGYLHWIGSSNKEEELISNKILVVTGEAGMGKTQLLANSVKETMSVDGYALLLLGHHYLSSSDISKQIMEKFEFDYAFREFLDMLDILGEIENQHIYIFIDAINETPNRSVWKNGLSTIISEICRRKHIKLILSVRTGYEKLIFEENMIERLKSGELLRITHHGFQDDSVAAIKEFLNCHNIPFSPSELLNYEMTNPLFLTLFCKTYNGEELNLFQMFERFITLTVKVKKTLAKLLPAHIHFCWEEEHDASKKETISFDIPCPELLDKLHLVQKKYDGYFFSQDGDLVAFDGELTDTINGLIIRKDYLDQFLQENDLGIFWDFVGEKQYFTESPREQYYSRWKGFFWMVNSEILSDIDLDEQKLGSIDF